MPIASANPFPSMLYVEGTTPASPSSGQQRLFVRSSDHVLCMVNSSGTVTALSGSLTNPMTTGGDLIYGGASGLPTRLANGSSGQALLSGGGTAAPTWGAAALAHSQLGYTSAGASFKTTRSGYYTQITIPSSGGFLMSINANYKGDGTNNHGIFPVIFDDNGSNVPRNLLYIPGAAVTSTPTRNEQTRFNTTARWVSFGVGTWYAGSTKLWIGVWMNANADSTIQLAYDASGGTSYVQSGAGFNWPTDNSIDSAHFSSSTDKLSIYADILS